MYLCVFWGVDQTIHEKREEVCVPVETAFNPPLNRGIKRW